MKSEPPFHHQMDVITMGRTCLFEADGCAFVVNPNLSLLERSTRLS
jgi:hypothetical protein